MDELKLGMIGLDTSHCPAFAKLLSDRADKDYVPGARVVAAFPGGSKKMAVSYNRIEKFTAQMKQEFGVAIVDSIEALAGQVDAILIESVDSRQHLEQFKAVAPFGKPVWIDKPLATSVKESKAIYELSAKHNAPVMSSSSVRFANGIVDAAKGKRALGCVAHGPASILDDFPGLFWYGIHAVEILYSKMGVGCAEVVARKTATADVVTGSWPDGRLGVLYAYRIPKVGDFGCTIYTDSGVVQAAEMDEPPAYALLLRQVLEFFRTRVSPIPAAETLEIMAFIEAANESRDSGRAVPVRV